MKLLKAKSQWFEDSDLRLDAEFHLSDGPSTARLLKKSPYKVMSVSKVTKDIFKGNIFKRCYVADSIQGFPFYTASDIVRSDLNTSKFVSKKFTKKNESLELKKNWILVSRSGTLGVTVFTNEDFENKIGTDDLIRIVPEESEILPGFLYAYLSSKFGYSLLVQPSYGGVVKHIEPHHIEHLPIPIFPKKLQEKINDLIITSSNLKYKYNETIKETESKLLKKAGLKNLTLNEFEYFGIHSNKRDLSVFKVNSKDMSSISINAFHYSKKFLKIVEDIKMKNKWIPLKETLNDKGIHSPPSIKVIPIRSKNGVKFINQKEIFNFKLPHQILAKQSFKKEALIQYGDILIAGIGTLGENEVFGRPVYINNSFKDFMAAGNFVRLRVKGDFPSGYLFAWLNTDYGFRLTRYCHTGTKQCMIKEDLFEAIPVPIFPKPFMYDIDTKVREAQGYLSESLIMENEAISIVEKEIESWQK